MACRSVAELEAMGPVEFRSFEALRVSVPMHEPFRISSGEVTRKDAVLLKVSDGTHFGWGESSAMPGAFYSADTPESCEQQLLEVLPDLVGRSFATIGELERELRVHGLSPFVRVAMETAAWELLARKQGVSLRELFGLPNIAVATGLAIGLYATLDELQAALERYGPQEYARLKIKIKRGNDLRLVRAVRQWYGDIPLFVDANADYTRDELSVFEELDAEGLMMFEQPFAKDDLDTSVLLQRRVRTPVCFDEGVESAADVREGVARDAVRIVNIKLQRVGGYLEACRIIEACEECGVPFWMGTMPELGVGSAQALVLAAHPNCKFPTDVEPSSRWYVGDVLRPELTMSNGKISIPDGAGLGFEVDESLLKSFCTQRWSF